MKSKMWLLGWTILVVIALSVIGGWVYAVDPFFHYHKPNTKKYFYTLNNERSMNNGICRNFEYDALITGSSMTENFKTSEMNEIFGVNSVKVPYAAGSYKEVNDNLSVALDKNRNLRIVVRGLDMDMFLNSASFMEESVEYPTYLYDDNPFNDVFYLFNKDVVFNRVYSMSLDRDKKGFSPGITSFDVYESWQNWQQNNDFGINSVCPNGIEYAGPGEAVHLTEDEKNMILENITQNVTSLADKYPNVDFYYFFTPYCTIWWRNMTAWGLTYKQIEAEQYIIELILEHQNIHLYSFNNRTDITADLNNYKDIIHYGQWINSLILRWIYNGDYLLTKDNYLDYLAEELTFYTTFDYNSMNGQPDYEDDFFAVAMLNQELTGTLPLNLLELDEPDLNLSSAVLVEDTEAGSRVLQCIGSLQREDTSELSVASYMINEGYVGAKIEIDEIDSYLYLVFEGKKVSDHGQPTVYIYNDQGEVLSGFATVYNNIDNEWHQYSLDLSKFDGSVTVIFNGGYVDITGNTDSQYLFKNIMLY